MREMIEQNRAAFGMPDGNEGFEFGIPYIVSIVSPMPGRRECVETTHGCLFGYIFLFVRIEAI